LSGKKQKNGGRETGNTKGRQKKNAKNGEAIQRKGGPIEE